MKGISFPIFKTKSEGTRETFALEDPVQRRKYFQLKAAEPIEKLREYLEKGNTFIGFLLGKKNSGKGTYAKLFAEAVGPERAAHISVGDIVRSVHRDLEDPAKRKELISFLERRYRGFITIERALDVILGRDTKTLLPTEVTLALIEREIDRLGRKALFIDGFPRNLDQVSYSLYFRALIGYRDDPDFFVFIDVPEAVIDERMKYRVVCPMCQTPRSPKLLRTKEIGYDEATREFYLKCDTPSCNGARLVTKEGDELGIEAIRKRVELDDKVMRLLLGLEGVPKVFLRNSVPVERAEEYLDPYEITPTYRYEWDTAARQVRVIEERWVVTDDDGVLSYGLLPAPMVVSMLHQIARVLGLIPANGKESHGRSA